MTNIREAMPLLARHEGVWDGVYSYFNDQNEKTDEHKSRLICRFPDDGPYPYHQTNHYLWDDGRTEIREFPAEYRDGRVWWDNDLIHGWAAEVPLDEFNRTVLLYRQRTGDPLLYLYVMIHLVDSGVDRCRTWHWIRNGVLETRTAIQEKLVTRDWRSLEGQTG